MGAVTGSGAVEAPRYFHGVVSRFAAGHVALPGELPDALRQMATADKLHVCGVNLSAQEMQALIGLLRHRGIEVGLDRLIPAPGGMLAVFGSAPLTVETLTAISNSAGKSAAKKVIDCEGYAYLTLQ